MRNWKFEPSEVRHLGCSRCGTKITTKIRLCDGAPAHRCGRDIMPFDLELTADDMPALPRYEAM